MQFTSTTGRTNRDTVLSIMAAKALDVIIGKPSTETMDCMTYHMTKMVTAVKTTAWGGGHGSLSLVLGDVDYRRLTRDKSETTNRLDPSTETAKSGTINFTSAPF